MSVGQIYLFSETLMSLSGHDCKATSREASRCSMYLISKSWPRTSSKTKLPSRTSQGVRRRIFKFELSSQRLAHIPCSLGKSQ